MKIKTYESLEDLVPKVESELEKAIQERQDLRLSVPEDYKIYLYYYNNEFLANAKVTKSEHQVQINALRLVLNKFKGEDRSKLNKILYYFDITRKFLGDEVWIIASINYPEETIKQFEKAQFKDEKEFKKYKDNLKAQGWGYDSYLEFTIQTAGTIKKLFDELMPKVKEEFKKTDLFLRHEIDHLDFFSSHLYQDYIAQYKRRKKLKRKIHLKKLIYKQEDASDVQEYLKANMGYLKNLTETGSLPEIRALFFNYVQLDEWEKADFEELKNKVYSYFHNNYIEKSYAQKIIIPLISQRVATGEMNLPTERFISYIANKKRQNTSLREYVIEPEKINYKLATEILYREFPRWKMELEKNARIAVEAIGDSYRDDPSRLKEANKARTFEDFIEVCKG